jgi:hypothetical protein
MRELIILMGVKWTELPKYLFAICEGSPRPSRLTADTVQPRTCQVYKSEHKREVSGYSL